MRKLLPVAALALLAVIAATAACSGTGAAKNAANYQYEVISPWAEADPIPPRGISPRIDGLEGKKIGLFANFKRSAVPQARMLEKKLKGKFSAIQTDLYHSTEENVSEIETQNREKFTAWVRSVDAIIAVVGD